MGTNTIHKSFKIYTLFPIFFYSIPHVLDPGVCGDSLYRGSVTSVSVASHTQVVVTA